MNSSRIAFFARDPGGASSLVPVIKGLIGCKVYAKDYASSIFKKKEINHTYGYVEFQNIEIVITATSYIADDDKQMWLEAKKNSIKSIAYFDHWMNFKRFYSNKEKSEIFPDCIICTDMSAKNSIKYHNPNFKGDILPLGNPLLENVPLKSNSSKTNNILYVAEKIRGYDLKDSYGIDEFVQFEKLYDAIETFDEELTIYFRPHPKHNIDEIKKYLRRFDNVVLDESLDKYKLLQNMDMVFGIHSMMMIEAMLMRVPTCSIQNDIKLKSDFSLLIDDKIFFANSTKDIINFIKNPKIKKFDRSYIEGSTDKIVKFIKGYR